MKAFFLAPAQDCPVLPIRDGFYHERSALLGFIEGVSLSLGRRSGFSGLSAGLPCISCGPWSNPVPGVLNGLNLALIPNVFLRFLWFSSLYN